MLKNVKRNSIGRVGREYGLGSKQEIVDEA